jgi:pimeloyl-ACP methyl ester carboxylesterase
LEAPHVFVEDVCIESIANLGDDVRLKLARHHQHPDELFAGWRSIWLDPAFRSFCVDVPRVPTLVIQGEDDEYGTLAQVDAIAPAERLILADCGHSPHRDQPDAVLSASAAFIRKLLQV